MRSATDLRNSTSRAGCRVLSPGRAMRVRYCRALRFSFGESSSQAALLACSTACHGRDCVVQECPGGSCGPRIPSHRRHTLKPRYRTHLQSVPQSHARDASTRDSADLDRQGIFVRRGSDGACKSPRSGSAPTSGADPGYNKIVADYLKGIFKNSATYTAFANRPFAGYTRSKAGPG